MDFEEAIGEVLQESKKKFIGNWRAGNPCYGVVEILVTLLPEVT